LSCPVLDVDAKGKKGTKAASGASSPAKPSDGSPSKSQLKKEKKEAAKMRIAQEAVAEAQQKVEAQQSINNAAQSATDKTSEVAQVNPISVSDQIDTLAKEIEEARIQRAQVQLNQTKQPVPQTDSEIFEEFDTKVSSQVSPIKVSNDTSIDTSIDEAQYTARIEKTTQEFLAQSAQIEATLDRVQAAGATVSAPKEGKLEQDAPAQPTLIPAVVVDDVPGSRVSVSGIPMPDVVGAPLPQPTIAEVTPLPAAMPNTPKKTPKKNISKSEIFDGAYALSNHPDHPVVKFQSSGAGEDVGPQVSTQAPATPAASEPVIIPAPAEPSVVVVVPAQSVIDPVVINPDADKKPSVPSQPKGDDTLNKGLKNPAPSSPKAPNIPLDPKQPTSSFKHMKAVMWVSAILGAGTVAIAAMVKKWSVLREKLMTEDNEIEVETRQEILDQWEQADSKAS